MKVNVMPMLLSLIVVFMLVLMLRFGSALEMRYWVMGSGLLLLVMMLTLYVLYQIRKSMRQYVREPTL